MALFSILPIFILSLLVSSSLTNSATLPKPEAFIFPVRKDDATRQYYTGITIGSNSTSFNVVIDLGAKFMFFNALDYFQAASSYRPVLCGTQQCRNANGVGCVFCFEPLPVPPPVPGCTNNTCSDYALNPFTGTLYYNGLGQDVLRVSSNREIQYSLNNFPFQFAVPDSRFGLATQTAGLIGLGRTKISLQAQLASAFKIKQKFSLCLPSSGNEIGNMIIGQTSYATPFQEIAKRLSTTSLIKNPVSTFMNENIGNLTVEYFIDVKSIKVGTKTLSLNKTLLAINKRTGTGGSNLRTVRDYSVLHRSIYNALVSEFVAAAAKSIRRVGAVSPFGACFDSKTIGNTRTGPDVPTIDLVLDSTSVFWRFYGSNSIVSVNNDVSCLAFLDGGANPFTTIVVGGYQMQNYLLEFDVASSKLRFSTSLSEQDTSCSQFKAS